MKNPAAIFSGFFPLPEKSTGLGCKTGFLKTQNSSWEREMQKMQNAQNVQNVKKRAVFRVFRL